MLLSEFVDRTGFMPTSDEYKALEDLYYDWQGDKDDFCAHFVKNKDAMMTKAREIACTRFEQERANILSKMNAAETECMRLKEAHKRELDFESRKLNAVIESKDRVIAELEERMKRMQHELQESREYGERIAEACRDYEHKYCTLAEAMKILKTA